VSLAGDGVDILLLLVPAVAQHGANVGQTAASTSVRFGITAVHHRLNLAGPAGALCTPPKRRNPQRFLQHLAHGPSLLVFRLYISPSGKVATP
jgi:hypothetical protein